MMGIKERNFRPLPVDLSLEALVPKDSFYRRLEERIDLSFVRELVLPLYANGGRHSIDPVVFFKLQLVLFFEDLRSERRLMEVVADRLSLRWYLGYDLDERLPDHSSLTKIRERYGPGYSAASSRGSSRCASRPGSSGARSCSSTRPRSKRTPPLTPWPPDGSSKPILRASSRKTTIITRAKRSLQVQSLRTNGPSTTCPRQETRTSFGPTAPAKARSPATAPRTAPSKGSPGARGPRTPGLARRTPMPPL